ncbi:MAG: nucleotide exchange factor GrpE [Pseudonocardiales bacterium]|nr:MAG: nucleotide exchange factor GrpE [Pseudonocardiales bacterium]
MTEPGRPGSNPEEPERVVIRDKRKIDPLTGTLRNLEPAADPGPAAVPIPNAESDEVAALQAAVAERTADLQRVQAEYANYRKRADRDRLAATDVAISRVLAELLPVLDDIDRARSHDDLTGALKAVADHLDNIFGKLGLQSFGEVGDPFDPAIHEAVLHTESDEVSEPTATIIMRRGYQHGDRLLRAAMVGVTEPATATADPAPAPAAEATGDDSAEQLADGDPPASDAAATEN